jgi:hypothetical protein
MSEFTFLFRGSDPTARSPEEMQKSMQKWLAWFKELGLGPSRHPRHLSQKDNPFIGHIDKAEILVKSRAVIPKPASRAFIVASAPRRLSLLSLSIASTNVFLGAPDVVPHTRLAGPSAR